MHLSFLGANYFIRLQGDVASFEGPWCVREWKSLTHPSALIRVGCGPWYPVPGIRSIAGKNGAQNNENRIKWYRYQQASRGDDASKAEAAPGRVGRGEQGETKRANSAPNGGPHLGLGRLRLKTWGLNLTSRLLRRQVNTSISAHVFVYTKYHAVPQRGMNSSLHCTHDSVTKTYTWYLVPGTRYTKSRWSSGRCYC